MNNTFFLSCAALSCLALAGCGGSGGHTIDPNPTGDLSYAAKLATRAIAEEGDRVPVGSYGREILDGVIATSTAPVPDSAVLVGTGDYSGGIIVLGSNDAIITGNIDLGVDFDAGSLDGRISNLFDVDDQVSIGGSLNISGAVESAGLTGDIAGTVIAEGQNVDVVGAMAGEFRGANAEYAAGDLGFTGAGETFQGVFYTTADR